MHWNCDGKFNILYVNIYSYFIVEYSKNSEPINESND